jgi:hypothetical protein
MTTLASRPLDFELQKYYVYLFRSILIEAARLQMGEGWIVDDIDFYIIHGNFRTCMGKWSRKCLGITRKFTQCTQTWCHSM